MKILNISSLCGCNYIENRENTHSCVAVIPGAEESVFVDCCAALLTDGFEKKEEYVNEKHRFCAFSKAQFGVFVNYYGTIREMYILEEEDSLYFSYTDRRKDVVVAPEITQIALEDFGMSYVIRLSDGRFIVIDGGRDLEPESDKLFKALNDGTSGKKPIVAAWIMTHPHSDHYHCFITFMDKYADSVIIEKFILNFPDADDFDHYPKLSSKDTRFIDLSPVTDIPRMYARMLKAGAPIYTAHTGQKYLIGDAACTILASMDDTIHISNNINSISLVIRMELGGQTILWTADANFECAQLADRYGDYLKSDILQVPHHGFGNGSNSEQIKGYELIKPSVCLLPVSDYNAYTTICTYSEGSDYLMHMPCIKEIVTGDVQRTLALPYTASDNAKSEYEHKYLVGRANGGSRTWVYSDLSTDCAEDFEFTLLNMTNFQVNVSIDLFFEDSARAIRYIKASIEKLSLKKICIIGDDVDIDALYFNWMSLKERGIPENSRFAVRFISDSPIVVSHKKYASAYHSVVV